MTKILAIVGPTAIGKSALALELAARLDGEIISCDSMQVYKGMDIGTAKATAAERARIKHHMIDVADPSENYSLAEYVTGARSAMEDILSRGKMPIFCGGTGLYLQQTLAKGEMQSPPADETLREMLLMNSPEENHRELAVCDPESAAAIHPNNVRRVVRALEIYRLSGIPKSEWDRRCQTGQLREDAKLLFLYSSDRARLYERIDTRVDEMMAAGLLDEVDRLGLDPQTTAGQAIGYKELIAYRSGHCTLTEAVEQIKKASRNYAKRQITWFRHMPSVIGYDVEQSTHCEKCDNFEDIVNFALSLLK